MNRTKANDLLLRAAVVGIPAATATLLFISLPFPLKLLSIANPANAVSSLTSAIAGAATYLVTERAYTKYKHSGEAFSLSKFSVQMLSKAAVVIGTGTVAVGCALLIPGMTQPVALSIAILSSGLAANLHIDIFNKLWRRTAKGSKRLQRGAHVLNGVSEKNRWIGTSCKWLLRWGEALIEAKDETLHGLIVGTTGVGKTTLLILCILSRRVPLTEIRENDCGLCNDPKRTLLPFFEIASSNFSLLNPLLLHHPNFVAWDIFYDICNPALIREFMLSLISESKNSSGSDNYFQGNARTLGGDVFYCLQLLLGNKAELRDFVLACKSKQTIKKLLEQYPRQFYSTLEMLKLKEADSIISTLREATERMQVVAAAWHHAPRKISVSTPLQQSEWVVLGADPDFEDITSLINSLFVDTFFKHILSLPDTTEQENRRVTVVLDELQSSKPIKSLQRALEMGRSKGMSIWLSILGVPGLKETYGDKPAETIIELCRHWALLGMGALSAKFFSDALGENEQIWNIVDTSEQWSAGPSGNSSSYSESVKHQQQRVKAVLQQELMQDSSFFDTSQGINGYFVMPHKGTHKGFVSWEDVENWSINAPAQSGNSERVDPRTETRLILEPWSDEERESLGLPSFEEMQKASQRPPRSKGRRGPNKGSKK